MSARTEPPVSPAIGELLEPTAAERDALRPEAPAWAAMAQRATEPTREEIQRLRARAPGRVPARAPLRLVWLVLLALALLWRPARSPALLPGGELVVLGPSSPRRITEDAWVEGTATVSVLARSATGAELALASGVAVFEVDPQGEARDIHVRAGPVEVHVTGTRFLVGRDGETVRVSVERGSVAVASPEGIRALRAGESWQWVPPTPAARLPASAAASAPLPTPPSLPAARPVAAPAPAAPAPAVDRQAEERVARAWVALLDARERGEGAASLLPQVDQFLESAQGSALEIEASLLRLELLAETAPPEDALRAIDRWLAEHPEGGRAGPALLLAGTVAAGRMGDCDRAKPYLVAARAAGPASVHDEAQRHLDACSH